MPAVAYLGPGNPSDEAEVLDLVEVTARQQGFFAIDTETISLKDLYCIGAGIAAGPHRYYVRRGTEFWPRVMQLIKDSRLTRVFHNVLFDAVDPLELEPVHLNNIADTSIMAQVQGIPAQLKRLVHLTDWMEIKEISDILPKGKTMLDLPFEVVAAKCLDDVKATQAAYITMGGPKWWEPDAHCWHDHLDQAHTVTQGMKECYQVDISLMRLLLKMGRRGIALRPGKVKDWLDRLTSEIDFYDNLFVGMGFNPNSPAQVGGILAERGSVLPLTKSHRQLATPKELLETLADPLAAQVLAYRSVSKLRSTYIKPWSKVSRALSHYRLDLATARLASYDRDLQNIPVPIRVIFQADSGTWTCADANQIEMRVAAFVTQDPAMMASYARGSDAHTETQLALWPGSDPHDSDARKRAKTWNFARLYRGKATTLSAKTGVPLKKTVEYMQVWDLKYPVAAKWLADRVEEADYVDAAPSIFGRLMRLPEGLNATVEHRQKCNCNYPIQNGAIEVVKRGMLRLDRAGGYDFATQVHDEILIDGDVEIPKDLGDIVPGMPIPYEVVKGPDWVKA